jgi:hypothetical protein
MRALCSTVCYVLLFTTTQIVFPVGLVTPARNQQSCGSCAAFAATATHETCLRNAGTPLDGLDLAEQQLVDCAYNPDNGANGCNGAWVGAYQTWMAGNGGTVIHESEYPYLNTQPNLVCQVCKPINPGLLLHNDFFSNSTAPALLSRAMLRHITPRNATLYYTVYATLRCAALHYTTYMTL